MLVAVAFWLRCCNFRRRFGPTTALITRVVRISKKPVSKLNNSPQHSKMVRRHFGKTKTIMQPVPHGTQSFRTRNLDADIRTHSICCATSVRGLRKSWLLVVTPRFQLQEPHNRCSSRCGYTSQLDCSPRREFERKCQHECLSSRPGVCAAITTKSGINDAGQSNWMFSKRSTKTVKSRHRIGEGSASSKERLGKCPATSTSDG